MKIHIAQKGDTLWEIAKYYGVDFEALQSLNTQLSSPDMMMPGMKIKVPGDEKMVKKKKDLAEQKESQLPQPYDSMNEENGVLQPAMPSPALPKKTNTPPAESSNSSKKEEIIKTPKISMHEQLPILEKQMNQDGISPEIFMNEKSEHINQKEKIKKNEKKTIQEPYFEYMQPMEFSYHHPMPVMPLCYCVIPMSPYHQPYHQHGFYTEFQPPMHHMPTNTIGQVHYGMHQGHQHSQIGGYHSPEAWQSNNISNHPMRYHSQFHPAIEPSIESNPTMFPPSSLHPVHKNHMYEKDSNV